MREHVVAGEHDLRRGVVVDEVARAIRWTRRHRWFSDLDLFSRMQAVNETAAHLEVLAVRGQLTRETGADGADVYLPAPLAR